MKNVLASMLVGAMLVLGFQVEAAGEKTPSAGDHRGARLLYVFSSPFDRQCERVRELQQLACRYGPRLQVVEMVRDAEGALAVIDAREAFCRDCGFSYPPMEVEPLPVEAKLSADLEAQASSGDDFVLRLGVNGEVSVVGSGRELTRLLDEVLSLSTDVSESTWGKIKELFQ